MQKSILLLILFSLFAIGPLSASSRPQEAEAHALYAASPATSSVEITMKGKNIRVRGAEGLTLDVYSITGVKVASVKIDSDDKVIALSVPSGVYILKVGKVYRKVSLA